MLKVRYFFIAYALLSLAAARAESEACLSEAYNMVSDQYDPVDEPMKTVRTIAGGTVIGVEFTDNCPYALRNSFSHACKLLEEFLPPSLPLKIKVDAATLRGSQKNAISKVNSVVQADFGYTYPHRSATMPTIKVVLMGEYFYNSTATFFEWIPDVEFLTSNPDITVTYNTGRLDEIDYSLDSTKEELYDGVTLFLRDILIGLGIRHNYVHDPSSTEFLSLPYGTTPFEETLKRSFSDFNDSAMVEKESTMGEFPLKLNRNSTLLLHAPQQWEQGVSLNYFIPQSGSAITKIMSFDFAKGQSFRDLTDKFYYPIMKTLLGLEYDFTVGSNSSSVQSSGNTSLVVPFKGILEIKEGPEYVSKKDSDRFDFSELVSSGVNKAILQKTPPEPDYEKQEEVIRYIDSFFPFWTDNSRKEKYVSGLSTALLKKDGTWDIVDFKYFYETNPLKIDFSDWTLHFSDGLYARTADGYLRACVTESNQYSATGFDYKCHYLVVDYLPQTIELNCSVGESTSRTESTSATASTATDVRIYLGNVEGLERVVLEKLRAGNRLPTKVEIKDFRKGYYDTTIDRTTTLTAVGYNGNGSSRSLPLTVEPVQGQAGTVQLNGDISGETSGLGGGHIEVYDLSGRKIGSFDSSASEAANALLPGIYVAVRYDRHGIAQETYKLAK